MKRKQVMAFLLAVAMVAGNVATGTPEIVKADPVTDAHGNAFSGGNLYVEVETIPHQHTVDCYTDAVQVKDTDTTYYYDKGEGTLALVTAGAIVVADTPKEIMPETNQKIAKDETDDKYYLYDITNAEDDKQDSITAAYYESMNYSKLTSDIKIALNSVGAITIEVPDNSYISGISGWTKLNEETDAATIAVITGTAFCVDATDYTEENESKYEGKSGITEAGVYAASILTEASLSGDETVTFDGKKYTYSDSKWTYLAKADSPVNEARQPYRVDKEEAPTKFVAKVYKEVTDSELKATGHDDKYKYGSVEYEKAQVKQGTTDKNIYYLDVSDQYVKSIAAKSSTPQDVASGTLDATLTATKYDNSTTDIESANVVTDLDPNGTYDGGEGSTVKVTGINSDLIAVLDDGDGILEAGEAKALSTLTAEDLKKLNSDTVNSDTDITFPVYKITDGPELSLSAGVEEIERCPAYEKKADAFTITAEDTAWTYTYKIDGADASAKVNENKKVDLSAVPVGQHTFTIVAQNKNVSDVEMTADFTIYVLAMDDGDFDNTKNFTYTGLPIAFKYTPSKGQAVTYSYRKHVENDDKSQDGFTQSGLPTDVGTYDIKAVIAANLISGYVETVAYEEEVTITKATKTEDKGTTTIVKDGDAVTLDFTDEISKYLTSDENIPETITFASDKTTVLDSLEATKGKLTLKTKSDAEVNDAITETLTAEINTLKNVTLTLKATVSIQKAGTEVKEVTVGEITRTYDKDATPETIKAAVLEGIKVGGETVSEDKLTIKYNESVDAPTDAGTYNINVSFSSGSAIGTGTGKLTINPKELTVKADDVEYTIGGTEPVYSAKLSDEATEITESLSTYVNGGTLSATCPSANLTHPGTYDIIPSATAASNNYKLNLVNGTLTVKAVEYGIEIGSNNSSWGTATPSVTKAAAGTVVTIKVSAASGYHLDGWQANDNCNVVVNDFKFTMPARTVSITAIFAKNTATGGNTTQPGSGSSNTGGGSPITSGDSTSTTDKPADTKPADKPADTTPAESNTITTNENGAQIIVGTDGAPVANKVVAIDGEKYITNDAGVIVKNDFATTAKGNKVFTDVDGKIVTDKTIVVDGKKYVAKESGALAVSEVVTTAKGNKVYCDATGAVVTDKTIKVDGKKYVAKENGVLAVSEMVTTAKGNKVYCGKTGAIVTGKSFKVDGKRYVASKTGAIVTSKWVKVGDKAYYCDKNGVVTKVKPAKKK